MSVQEDLLSRSVKTMHGVDIGVHLLAGILASVLGYLKRKCQTQRRDPRSNIVVLL